LHLSSTVTGWRKRGRKNWRRKREVSKHNTLLNNKENLEKTIQNLGVVKGLPAKWVCGIEPDLLGPFKGWFPWRRQALVYQITKSESTCSPEAEFMNKKFVEVSGHNLENYQTWGFQNTMLILQTSFKHILLGGGGVNSVNGGDSE
jgi:hypothetical protein